MAHSSTADLCTGLQLDYLASDVRRLEDVPYSDWPDKDPEEDGEDEFEDPLHVLSRNTWHTTFQGPVKVCLTDKLLVTRFEPNRATL